MSQPCQSNDASTKNLVPEAAPEGTPPRRNYARWRAFSLSLVYVIFGIHIVHWKITGSTLAPLELNEVMYTLELGIITAGFLFMCTLVLGSLLVGRFFCSWACHIMVLQDLCAWLLRKIGIRAKPIRSRLLLWVPPLTAFYMFAWPQIVRTWQSRALPTFHLASDADGWASMVTTNFWRNLPGPWIIAVTFLVCGFAMVYVLGSRTFCTYVCPYGAVFGLADRLSPGRIRVSDACQQCGTCTATCTSGIRVHEEVKQHGMVVNPACLKCLDCISVCPHQALSYGFGKPALLRSRASGGRFGSIYDFSVGEEFLLGVVFLAALLSFRGLYSRVPFLLSLGSGVIVGYLCVAALRMATRPDVKLASMRLKRDDCVTAVGGLFVVAYLSLMAFVCHSGYVRYHEYTGLQAVRAMRSTSDPSERRVLADRANTRLTTSAKWGLLRNPRVEKGLVLSSTQLERYDEGEQHARQYLSTYPYDLEVHLRLAQALSGQDRMTEAEDQFRMITQAYDESAGDPPAVVVAAHQTLAELLAGRGDQSGAVVELRRTLELDPKRAAAHAELGSTLADLGQIPDAIESLREAIRLDPNLGRAHYNLGTLLGHQQHFEEAIPHLQQALETLADDADVHNNLGFSLLRTSRPDEARTHFEQALVLNADHAGAHFNLAVILESRSELAAADEHFQIAARLDPRYANLRRGR